MRGGLETKVAIIRLDISEPSVIPILPKTLFASAMHFNTSLVSK